MKRYTVNISFKHSGGLMSKRTTNIVEEFKTLHEASKLRDLIDETVDKALIKDNVTENIIYWKGER